MSTGTQVRLRPSWRGRSHSRAAWQLRIDEVEAKDNFCKDATQAYEKAGFIYFLDANSKETKRPS
ncbi:MAG: hypothetical protein ACKO1Q_12885, partial [Vulcanococcus sp.]